MDQSAPDNAVDACVICHVAPARPDNTWCGECRRAVWQLFGIALLKTLRRLAPEACTLLALLVLSQVFGAWLLWGLLPLLGVAVVRGKMILRRQSRQAVQDFCRDLTPVWAAQGYLEGLREGRAEAAAEFHAEIRHQAAVLGIPLTEGLEAALRGELRWEEISDSDKETIRPAFEAVAKRRRQIDEAYGIKADLPLGSDPVC